jgi:choline dehydrogenase-like flavoprotein
MQADVIIVGSGPAGVHAALALLEAGRKVLMIDAGYTAHKPSSTAANFEDVRGADPEQWKLFLGEDLSSIPVSGLSGGMGGGMASGNRSYVTRDTDAYLPLQAEGAQIIQTLAQGGLAAAWGGACAYFDDRDLLSMKLPGEEMQRAYDEVTSHIGISGPQTRPGIQPPLRPDLHAEILLQKASERLQILHELDSAVLQPHSAILTQDMEGRKATGYQDMDYYCDPGRSLYRPSFTLETLKKNPNFLYVPGLLAETISEDHETAAVSSRTIGSGLRVTHRAKRVVLAAGAIGTARILLRTLRLEGKRVPFLSKPHAFIAIAHPRTFGKAGPKERVSVCQLMFMDTIRDALGFESGCAQIYGYRSMLLFRLLGSMPLPAPEAMRLLSALSPSMLIADVRFPIANTMGTLRLENQTMHVEVPQDDERRCRQHASLKRLRLAMQALGLWTLKTMDLPEGTASHYAGTVPVSDNPSLPLSADEQGKVRQMRHVYAADASLFEALPAKPHTLTLMANARRIAQGIVRTLG